VITPIPASLQGLMSRIVSASSWSRAWPGVGIGRRRRSFGSSRRVSSRSKLCRRFAFRESPFSPCCAQGVPATDFSDF